MVDGRAWRYEVLTWLAPGFVHAVSNPFMAVLNYSQFVAAEVRAGHSGESVCALTDTLVEETERLEALMTPFFNLLRRPSLDDLSIMPLDAFIQGIDLLVSTSLRHQRIEWRAEVMADAPAITCDVQSTSYGLLSAIYGVSQVLSGLTEGDVSPLSATGGMDLEVGAESVLSNGKGVLHCKVSCMHPAITVDFARFDALDAVRANTNVSMDVVEVRAGAFDVFVTI